MYVKNVNETYLRETALHLFFRIEMDPELTEEALGALQFAPASPSRNLLQSSYSNK